MHRYWNPPRVVRTNLPEVIIVLVILGILAAIVFFAVSTSSSSNVPDYGPGSRSDCRDTWFVDTGYKKTYAEWQLTHPGCPR